MTAPKASAFRSLAAFHAVAETHFPHGGPALEQGGALGGANEVGQDRPNPGVLRILDAYLTRAGQVLQQENHEATELIGLVDAELILF